MGKRSKIDQHQTELFQQQREAILKQIGGKLEEQFEKKNVNANMVATATRMKPETLYKIRDGLQFPACETIIKIKQIIPELNLNWWLFNQGEPNLQMSNILLQENERLRKQVQAYQQVIQDAQQLFTKVNLSEGPNPIKSAEQSQS